MLQQLLHEDARVRVLAVRRWAAAHDLEAMPAIEPDVALRYFGRLVEKLKRIKVGFLELGELKQGEWRSLNPKEVAKFRRILKLEKLVATSE